MLQTRSNSYGLPADNLPYVDVVLDSVKKNIIAGKYVNLASLLIPDYESSLVDNPQRWDELDFYEADIDRIYEHYGSVLYQYHVTM